MLRGNMDALIGKTLGPYRILEKIGRGGMAAVYKAYQPSLDRNVAVKVLPALLAEEPSFTQRFRREARAVGKLKHPHILAVYDFGQEEDLSYIAMPLVETGTLKGIMGKPMRLERIANLINQVAEALDHAHEKGIVHRDVKPSNVLLERGDWALLTDFGVARMVESVQRLTATGVGVGTPAYMSPEQGQGKKVDLRSDVYSLGVVLYEMLTGRVPFEAETPLAVVWKHVNDPLPLPRLINPKIPEEVERVVLKAMAKKPDDRYKTAGALAQTLKTAVREAKDERLEPVSLGDMPTQDVLTEAPKRALSLEGAWKFKWFAPAVAVIALALILLVRPPWLVNIFNDFMESISKSPAVTIGKETATDAVREEGTVEPKPVPTSIGAAPPEPFDPQALSLYDDFNDPLYDETVNDKLWIDQS